MAKADKYTFTYREVAEALVKQQGLHDGIWGVVFEFGIGGANTGTSEDQLLPTALVPILRMGLLRVEQEGALAVDAAKVNPSPAALPAEVDSKARKVRDND